jgi:flagellar biosynthesis protein FlhF
MKIKKYTAPSMSGATKKIREELGNEAVILSSKVIYTGGFLGMFKTKKIEVIAAIDEEVSPVSSFAPRSTQKEEVVEQVTLPSPVQQIKEEQLLAEITNLKELLSEMKETKRVSSNTTYPHVLSKWNSFMQGQEVSSSFRLKCMERLLEKWYMHQSKASEEMVESWVKEVLYSQISHLDYGRISNDCKYINVVGPTGVGKTTTLAKIAAEATLKLHKKIAFITTDTYRIGAIEQLKTYATILNVPIEVCYTLEDFHKAINKFEEYDLVLIDTAGRNFTDEKYIEGLKEIIDFSKTETLLVLSLTSKYEDMRKITTQFQAVGINRLVFTKMDETSSYGSMLNIMDEYNLGVAYMTNGQNVPDDIVEGHPTAILKGLMERYNDERSS